MAPDTWGNEAGLTGINYKAANRGGLSAAPYWRPSWTLRTPSPFRRDGQTKVYRRRPEDVMP